MEKKTENQHISNFEGGGGESDQNIKFAESRIKTPLKSKKIHP